MKGTEILDKMQAGEAGKGGGDDAAAAAAAKAASDAAAAKAAADATAAAAAKAKADGGAKEEFDPTDLIEDGEEPGKTEELPKYEEVAKDEVKRKAAFASMSTKIVELQKELKEVRSKGGGGEPSEREKALELELGKQNLMFNEDFKKTYLAPVGEAWQQVEVNLKSLNIPADKIAALQRATLAQRAEMLKDHASALPFLSPLFADYDTKRAVANREYLKGNETVKKLAADRGKQIETVVAASAEQVLTEVSKTHNMFKKADGNEPRNKRIDSDVTEAKKLAIQAASDPKVALQIALLAQAAKRYPQMVTKLMAQLGDAEKAKLRATAGRAKIGGDNGSSKTAGDRADLKGVPSSKKTQAMVEDMAQRFGH